MSATTTAMASQTTSRDAAASSSDDTQAAEDTMPETDGVRADAADEAPPKQTFFQKIGLDAKTVILMIKGSLPPTIGLAIYQSTPVSEVYQTLGYLIPIISVLTLSFLPRGRFIQLLFLHVLSACFGAAMGLLIMWTALQARYNTQPGPDPPRTREHPYPPYNASQCAVAGVWLFFNIWALNAVRAKFPAFNLPAIIYAIFIDVACSYSSITPDMALARMLIRQLLEAMLTAMALSAGVSLLVVPISSRTVVFAEMRAYLDLLRGSVHAQGDYLRTLETEDMFAIGRGRKRADGGDEKKGGKMAASEGEDNLSKNGRVLKERVAKLLEVHGKLHGDINFVERDGVWGKLLPEDLYRIRELLRSIAAPVVGMSTIMDIFDRIGRVRGWSDPTENSTPETLAEKEQEKRVWNEVMKHLHEPFELLSSAMDQGLEHAGLVLEIVPRPKKEKTSKKKTSNPVAGNPAGGPNADVDVEHKAGGAAAPGESGFAAHIEGRIQLFHAKRAAILQAWAREAGMLVSGGDEKTELAELKLEEAIERVQMGIPVNKKERDMAQLFVLLYLVKLMHNASVGVHDLVLFADSKVQDGTMRRHRILLPTIRRLGAWVASIFRNEDTTADEAPELLGPEVNVVYFGDGFNRKKDPEHLPPANWWQLFGDWLRAVSHFLGSEESALGFRAACATMSVGIVALLEKSRIFFIEERLVWAMVIIAFSMTMTSGQSTFAFIGRVVGTIVAMVFSYIAWYIVDGHIPGVIVFAWLFMFLSYYFLVKFPRFISIALTGLTALNLILGYELQVKKIGEEAAAASGQKFYPTYILAPYRVAAVAGGCLVSFFWTIFPSPLTDRTWLRRDLSAALYLLANFFSVVNQSLKTKLTIASSSSAIEAAPFLSDEDVPNSPAHKLRDLRRKLFGKLTLLLPSLEAHAHFQKWEPNLGGRFPREVYEEIILRCTRISHYLALAGHTISWPPRSADGGRAPSDARWVAALTTVLEGLAPMQHRVISTLTLLSNSLLSGQSLPPFMHHPPPPYELSRQLEAMGGEAAGILDVRNMEEHGFAEFAVLQVCATLIYDDLQGLVAAISRLVGIVDFSFKVEQSQLSLAEGQESGDERTKGKGKVE